MRQLTEVPSLQLSHLNGVSMRVAPAQPRKPTPGRLGSAITIDAIPCAAEIESEGARFINASSSDLLGLACDARVKDAASGAVRRGGLGRHTFHRDVTAFESRLAQLLKVEASALLSDGAWGLHGWSPAGQVVEAADTRSGELAPLPRIAQACERTGAALLVVDRLGLGLLGPNGLGAMEHFGLGAEADLQLFELGRVIPGVGLLAAGKSALVDTFRGLGQAPPTAEAAATARALEIALEEPLRRSRAFDLAQRLLDGFRNSGLDTGPTVTPWIPVWMGDEALAEQWLRALAQAQVAAQAWLSGHSSHLLVALPATATDAQVETVSAAFSKLAKRLPRPEVDAAFLGSVTLARPGTFAIATPCDPRWHRERLAAPDSPPTAVSPESENLHWSERLIDAVETFTWRATNARSRHLGLRGAEALAALLDRRRSK